MINAETVQCRRDALTNLDVPDGASGVNARCAQPLWICLVPIKGCQRRTELAVLVLHQHFSVGNDTSLPSTYATVLTPGYI